MQRHFTILEEINYVKSGAPTPQCEYEEKTSRPREKKTNTRQSEQQITKLSQGHAGMLRIACPQMAWEGCAAIQNKLRR